MNKQTLDKIIKWCGDNQQYGEYDLVVEISELIEYLKTLVK